MLRASVLLLAACRSALATDPAISPVLTLGGCTCQFPFAYGQRNDWITCTPVDAHLYALHNPHAATAVWCKVQQGCGTRDPQGWWFDECPHVALSIPLPPYPSPPAPPSIDACCHGSGCMDARDKACHNNQTDCECINSENRCAKFYHMHGAVPNQVAHPCIWDTSSVASGECRRARGHDQCPLPSGKGGGGGGHHHGHPPKPPPPSPSPPGGKGHGGGGHHHSPKPPPPSPSPPGEGHTHHPRPPRSPHPPHPPRHPGYHLPKPPPPPAPPPPWNMKGSPSPPVPAVSPPPTAGTNLTASSQSGGAPNGAVVVFVALLVGLAVTGGCYCAVRRLCRWAERKAQTRNAHVLEEESPRPGKRTGGATRIREVASMELAEPPDERYKDAVNGGDVNLEAANETPTRTPEPSTRKAKKSQRAGVDAVQWHEDDEGWGR